MNFKPLFFLFTIPLLSNLCAQDTIPFNDFDIIQGNAYKLSSDGKYHEAYLEYEKLNKNDSNYIHSLISKSYYLLNDEQLDSTRLDLVIDMTQEAINHTAVVFKLNYFINKGVALSKQTKYKEALKIYDEALLSYPKNAELHFKKGMTYELLNQFDKAVEMYKQTIIFNPFFKDAHLKLGSLCYKGGKITEALICFNFYLILNPDGENSLTVLSALNTIASSKNDIEDPIDIEISKDDPSFEELDLVINNRVALNKKYKIKNKIKIALVKQNHLLLEQLKDYEGNNGFFHQKYIPFYNWIIENNHFDDFIYTICFSTTTKEYSKIIKPKTENVKSFYRLSVQKIGDIFSESNIEFNGKKQPVLFYFKNKELIAIGEKEGTKMIGYCEVFASDGYVRAKGSLNNSESKYGKWFWLYENGNTETEAHFKDGDLDGTYNNYFNDGSLNYSVSYINGKVNGEYKLYNEKGALIETKIFVDDLIDGEYKSFHDIGEAYPKHVTAYKAGKINGKSINYFTNGTKKWEEEHIDGKIEGVVKSYYKNGQLNSEMNYKEGIIQGEYKNYFPDGKIKITGQYLNGEKSGDWVWYHYNGNIDTECNYIKGKLNGLYKNYDVDGKHYSDHEYRKGDLYSFSFFDKTGELIRSDDKKSGTLNYKSYFPNGNMKSEGLYDLKGGSEGEWKYYSKNGVLNNISIYKENLATDKAINYYNNGQEKSTTYYKNDTTIGYYLERNQSGKIIEQGWFKKGSIHGIWEYYYPNSVLKQKTYYNKGKYEGQEIEYDVEGKISAIFHYNNDKLELEKYYTNGTLYDSIVLPSNEKDSLYTHYTNGKTYAQIFYNYGKKNGKYVNYYPNGKTKTMGQYLNSERNGEWIWYYDNGNVKSKYNYIYGDINGDVIDYHKNGKIKSTNTYLLGEINGEEKDFNEEGILTSTIDYELGVKKKWQFFSPNGHLQLIRFYNNNQMIGYSYLDKNGKEIPIIPIKNETAKIISYFDNGKKSREMEIVNGDFTNKYVTYYYSGQISRETAYKYNEREGVEKTYHPTGKIKKIEPYFNGMYNGNVIEYYENGAVKNETDYVLGEKHGKSNSYSKNGTILTQKSYYNGKLIFK